MMNKQTLEHKLPSLSYPHRHSNSFLKINLPPLNIQGLEASMRKLSTAIHMCTQSNRAKIVSGKKSTQKKMEFKCTIWIMQLHHIHDSLL